MAKEFKNILVISLQGIGDLLLATPLLRGLKLNLPEARLSVLTLRSNKDILSNNPYVDDIIVFDANANRYIFTIPALLCDIRKRHPDLSICAYPSGLRSAAIGYLSGANERFGQELSLFKNYRLFFTKQTPITEVKHAVMMNLDFLKLLDVDIGRLDSNPILDLSEKDERFSAEFLKTNKIGDNDLLIAIHAGGGRYTAAYRSWPKERFAQVADFLIEKFNAKVIFIGGAGDETTVKEISKKMVHPPLIAAGRVSLTQTAAIIQKSRLLICNNSAPMHMAAALRVPTVSIFGSADPRIHRPYGHGHIVLRKELECSPCYYPFFRDTLAETKIRNRWSAKKFRCASDDYRCLSSITVEDVLSAAESFFKGRVNT